MRWTLALMLATTAPLRAQTGEVVQAMPSAQAVSALNRHLASLSRNPQDVTALLGAGQAALDLGDIQAANGFFTRANMVNPGNGQTRLGLAVVQLALKQPQEAAGNFDAAAALGTSVGPHLVDRALAYDLTGQQAKAQQDYRAALSANPANQTAQIRYAISLAIAGNLAEADKQLAPALASGDREAWRMRAFVFAMNGRISDARTVTQSVMPKGLADALDPYLQRLPLLDARQKAAAVHYGEYPNNVLRLAAPEPARNRDVQTAAATSDRDASRRPTAAERRAAQKAARDAARQPARQAAAAPAPDGAQQPLAMTPPAFPQPVASPPTPVVLATNNASAPSRVTSLPPGFAPTPAPAPTLTPAPTPVPGAARPIPTAPRPPVAMVQPLPAQPVQTAQAVPPVQPTQPTATTITSPPRTLADSLSALHVPEGERTQSSTAVDMASVARIQEQRRIAAEVKARADAEAKRRADVKAKADAEAKAKADAARKAEAERKAILAANPSRNFVQIATGRNVDALAFDLRRLRRTYSEALTGQDGWTAEWGQTRRLLIGPYRRPEDARTAVAAIKKAGGDAFLWQSEAGEEVAKIGGR